MLEESLSIRLVGASDFLGDVFRCLTVGDVADPLVNTSDHMVKCWTAEKLTGDQFSTHLADSEFSKSTYSIC